MTETINDVLPLDANGRRWWRIHLKLPVYGFGHIGNCYATEADIRKTLSHCAIRVDTNVIFASPR